MAAIDRSKSGVEKVKRCGFYVQRKRRHCRMIPAHGNTYCAEHLCHQPAGIDDNSCKETQDGCNVRLQMFVK